MPADCGGVGVGTTVGSGHLAAAGAARAPSKVSADCASSDGPFVGGAKNIVFCWTFGWPMPPGSCTFRPCQRSLSESL